MRGNWSTLKKLIWERGALGGGGSLPPGYRRLAGIEFNASTIFVVEDFKLRGSDTVRISFSVDKACNVFGCYTTSSAENNYSLYASTTSGGKYMRYNGGTYKSYFPNAKLGERFDVVITPTGISGFYEDDTWEEKDFTASADLVIGSTATVTSSSKLDGIIYDDFIVDGRLHLVPVEDDYFGDVGYYDLVSEQVILPTTGTPIPIYKE